ncbi:MAG: GTPase Era [Acidimicrobiales bacterium]
MAGDSDREKMVVGRRDREKMRSGFAGVVGRPNVGKSSLVNAMVGAKVSIVSDKSQTTRRSVQGVVDRPGVQMVLVDTPGMHKPRTKLGERLNRAANASAQSNDVVLLVVDGEAGVGRGDAMIASNLRQVVSEDRVIVALNKTDRMKPDGILRELQAAFDRLCLAELFPVSARTGQGVKELADALVARMPEGPRYYPEGMLSDQSDTAWLAELVREQLLALTDEELPHSIACQVTDWDWPHITCEILVERESQKPIVIGHKGRVLKQVGTAVRSELPPGAFLELVVRLEKNWQRRPEALDRLGY